MEKNLARRPYWGMIAKSLSPLHNWDCMPFPTKETWELFTRYTEQSKIAANQDKRAAYSSPVLFSPNLSASCLLARCDSEPPDWSQVPLQ